MDKYTSSIVTKYGDVERVKADVITLRDILSRQGASLLIDVIAENTGETANKFALSGSDRARLVASLVDELEASLKERL